MFAAFIACLLAGSLIYCLLIVVASLRFLRQPAFPRASLSPASISVLKPLSGNEDGLRENLLSFFTQDYRTFEIILAVRDQSDPAYTIAASLLAQYPNINGRLLVTGEPPSPNAKVHSLGLMTAAASHDLLVMSDSDIRVPNDFLRRISDELFADRYDLATCPYRAVPGNSIWSRLEALGMNTEFWGAAFVAKLVEGVRFTIGPTVVTRRKVLDAIPWHTLNGFLAEDFVLGQRAAELGFRVDFSSCVVEHRLSSDTMQRNFAHRLRWARSTRRSRPTGYLGQFFTYPLPLAMILIAVQPAFWPLFVVTVVLRALAAYVVSTSTLGGKLRLTDWILLPLQDILAFGFWLGGFSGNHIHWRGKRYRLHRDGTFELVT